jgi:hypothetical protein
VSAFFGAPGGAAGFDGGVSSRPQAETRQAAAATRGQRMMRMQQFKQNLDRATQGLDSLAGPDAGQADKAPDTRRKNDGPVQSHGA